MQGSTGPANIEPWLANQSFSQPSQQIAFQHYCQSLEQIEDRILQLDQEISRLLPEWSLCNLVCQLQALKGVGQLTAITPVAELGDFFTIFQSQTTHGFSGTGSREYSSGNSIRPRGNNKSWKQRTETSALRSRPGLIVHLQKLVHGLYITDRIL